jgi:biotin carboxyl carrier protein
MVMEAMKMETEIHAPTAGTISEIAVKQGDQLKAGELLAVIS